MMHCISDICCVHWA